MDKITWNDSYSVGIEMMDLQHLQIIDMINLLIANPGAKVGSETVSDLLTRLTAYATAHFKTEEDLLQKHGYPEIATQVADHKAYLKKVVVFCTGTMAHNDAVPTELLVFLKNWWQEHILVEDMKYRMHLTERGEK